MSSGAPALRRPRGPGAAPASRPASGSVAAPGPVPASPATFDAEFDRRLFAVLTCVLLGFGTLMVQSASVTSWPTEFERVYLSRHVAFLALAVAAAWTCSLIPERVWLRAAPWLFAGTVLLLVAVLVPGIGTRVNGAQRWLRFGSLSGQPSELAKLTLPLLLARRTSLHRERLRWFWFGTFGLLWPVALTVLLVGAEPDLGTALFLAAGAGIVLLAGGWPLRNFAAAVLLAVPACASLVVLRPYQMKRLTGFAAMWSDASQAPYQLKQSLLSLGTGGLTGVGLGRGWQKLSFLPEANTDFVFAVVGEELGLVGTVGLLALWTGLYLVGLRLLRRTPRGSFAHVAGFALLAQVALQAVLNVAVVTGMVPPKGIAHPLLSYGGSNLVTSVVALGLIAGLTRNGGEETRTEDP